MAGRYPRKVHEFISENVAGRTTRELAALVNEKFGPLFTESSMNAYMRNHKLRSGTPPGIPVDLPTKLFPQAVRDYILANYKGTGHRAMTDLLNAEFGTNYTVVQIKAFYGRNKLDSGLTGRFEKGSVPPNKGKKGVCAPGCERTQFKKGALPANTKPIGYERISKDGYVEVKVKMRPSRPDCNDNFVAKHRLIWEQLHGTIPANSIIIFKDGDKSNFDPNNLALITKAERLEMNRHSLFTKDQKLTEVGIMVARVNTMIHKKRKKANNRNAANQQEEDL